MREILDVADRCTTCDAPTALLLQDYGLDDDGEPFVAVWREALPGHNCSAFGALMKEVWPWTAVKASIERPAPDTPAAVAARPRQTRTGGRC